MMKKFLCVVQSVSLLLAITMTLPILMGRGPQSLGEQTLSHVHGADRSLQDYGTATCEQYCADSIKRTGIPNVYPKGTVVVPQAECPSPDPCIECKKEGAKPKHQFTGPGSSYPGFGTPKNFGCGELWAGTCPGAGTCANKQLIGNCADVIVYAPQPVDPTRSGN